MLSTVEDLRNHLQASIIFLNQFKHLTDAYIIEYFTDSHWEKLPESWRSFLDDFEPPDLAEQLLSEEIKNGRQTSVCPLSLLCFKRCSRLFALKRPTLHCSNNATGQNKLLKHIYRKHISPKKQHEISILAKVIEKTFLESNCSHVIDAGSGQGHLSRLLTLGYDLPVIALEREETFLEEARKFDVEAMNHVKKVCEKEGELRHPPMQVPTHVHCSLPPDEGAKHFIQKLSDATRKKVGGNSADNRHFLLTGLHACGDLSATMVRLFKESSSIKSLISVSCCYMKLTTDCINNDACDVTRASHIYYPMSDYVGSIANHQLPYKARELSCHAIEDYRQRLKENGPHLKMHCYRAVLEVLLRRQHPDLIRAGVRTVKKAYNLPFTEYVKRAFQRLNLPPCDITMLCSSNTEEMLNDWRHLVTYFTLSLLLAPVIESVILMDRLLYLKENGFCSEISSIFEPLLSPRCFVIIATKES
ncbi:methyltransferase-like protein 25B [Clavelina lepadiformis]|uniref:methyltransferase-like protein 25B n=1 Tax=Clavelina lepadiformis TaxID=159417 RepID=UPI0040422A2A